MLLIIARCADGWRTATLRPWIAGALIFTGVYFAWFAWPLIGFNEAKGAESSLARIANQLNERSVMLVDETSMPRAFLYVTPLRLWFGKNLYNVRDMNEVPSIVRDLRHAGLDDVMLMSADSNTPASFTSKMKLRFEQTLMARSPLMPRRATQERADFVLSRLDDAAFNAQWLASADGLAITDMSPSCCTGFMTDHIWTEERASIHGLALPPGAWHRLIITMRGHRPDYVQSGLVVRANGKELAKEKVDGRTVTFALGPMQGPVPFNLDLDMKPFVPRELGLNDDPRSLGVDIETLRVE
jgi:hypothetical protein